MKKSEINWKIICLVAAVIIFAAALGLSFFAFINGSKAVKQAFDRERKSAENAVYQGYYEDRKSVV